MTATLLPPSATSQPNLALLGSGVAEIEVPREGPYKILFERLIRLVRCRADLVVTLERDPGNQTASAELVRVRHMIKEVHRGVSINAEARALAARIDPA